MSDCTWHSVDTIKNEDKTIYYCQKCNAVLKEEKYWYGTIKLGDFDNRFEVDSVGLDLETIISTNLKITGIKITKVMVVEREQGWGEVLSVWFNLNSNTLLNAIIDYTRGIRYHETGEFFVAPETPEAE